MAIDIKVMKSKERVDFSEKIAIARAILKKAGM